MSKHTPGPWIATGYKQTIVNDSRGNTIAMYPTGDRTTETAKANARLIAAAPELLEALEYILSWSSDGEKWNPELARDMAIAAIAKATGVQS